MTRQAVPMDVREVNKRVIEQFRAGGEVDGMHRERLVLLTTTGRRSGEPRTTPMMFHRDGDRVLVIASNIGAPRHPDWYLNLVADPEVTVEVGDESGAARRAVARALEGAEREPVWEMLKATYPFFAEHEQKTTRTIPVVALLPSTEG
ncbi:deazaflavin-dependent oxidoreductase (nitroreductase family) [Pseudonocardia hierapolitana]|uniref:Deazaflavin-dependent oxidoreductase (Nitroreductase family) n=1 Tax=Pseudonocardia hierapolitana TaxID=1128676 RepID=A0A561SJ09_9PSEU|nr:nitroreductase/quinone reductase family protein [Pseudonocardia hierapolitana]TWF74860.1 deazaflavin-dependent oxidoreductase (nitroreductase family) [Pseudonocardia hierapolitana]